MWVNESTLKLERVLGNKKKLIKNEHIFYNINDKCCE